MDDDDDDDGDGDNEKIYRKDGNRNHSPISEENLYPIFVDNINIL